MSEPSLPEPSLPDPSLPDPSLPEKVLRIEDAFARAHIAHAFGGAIALAYYATPRGTIDIDVNVFVDPERAEDVLAVLRRLGAADPAPAERERLDRDGQTRVRWGATPVDVFFAYDPFHDACMERRRVLPFGEGDRIHVLAPEDLVVFKAIFDRAKDWRDIDEVVFAMGDELDVALVEDWLERIVGRDDARFRRFSEAAGGGSGG